MISIAPKTKHQLLDTLRKMNFKKFELINMITLRDLKKQKFQMNDNDVVDVVIIKNYQWSPL